MKFLSRAFLILMILSVGSSCGQNPLKELASKTDTDAAKYSDILKLLNDQKFDDVIEYIDEQSSEFQALEQTIEYKGQAQLGKCGFTFATFIDGMSNSAATQFMQKFAFAFQGRTIDPASCFAAQQTFENLSDSATNKNLSLLFVGMAKMGTYARQSLDTNDDGVVDADACQAGALSDDNAKQVITGLGLIIMNFAGLLGDLAGADISQSVNDFKTSCEAEVGAGLCSITDPTDPGLNGAAVTAFRLLLDSNTFGFGDCDITEDTPEDGDGLRFCCLNEATP